MSEKKKKLKVGKESVVMGDVEGEVGDGSVVIGATDNRGNVILNQSMAIGKGAYAGHNSIAIGAYAGAGASFVEDFNKLGNLIISSNNKDAIKNYEIVRGELTKDVSAVDKGKLKKSWDLLRNLGAINGIIEVTTKIKPVIDQIIDGTIL